MIDNTTQDWFALQGREEKGWTAIQFKRLFDTCDRMDYPIKVRNIEMNCHIDDNCCFFIHVVWNE